MGGKFYGSPVGDTVKHGGGSQTSLFHVPHIWLKLICPEVHLRPYEIRMRTFTIIPEGKVGGRNVSLEVYLRVM